MNYHKSSSTSQSGHTRFFRLLFISSIFLLFFSSCHEKQLDPPNILWIVSEDNGPFLGCYGDSLATTPVLDRLASEGFLYTHAFANNPVCAPARNTIITGVYSASNGCEQMRSNYPLSPEVVTLPELLQQSGYYCTNNSKTDYNYLGDYRLIWDESSDTAHYNNRHENQPFFSVFNIGTTHESQIFKWKADEELRHDPAAVVLPPYHPDTEEMRHDWAQYYDKIEDMDAQVGTYLKELEESGEIENTIVFYYSDHGGVLARSKRHLYDSGTHIPLIIRIPKKYKKYFPEKRTSSSVDRLVSFVDFAPTLLSLAGIQKPDYMQGTAFLGKHKGTEPDYVHLTRGRMDEFVDMSRAVRNKEFKYIKNYMPFRIHIPHLAYLFNARSAQSWEDLYNAGLCDSIQSVYFRTKPIEELYEISSDPHEVTNLADNPDYQDILKKMRDENSRWMTEIKDVSLMPETEYMFRAKSGALYDYMRSGEISTDSLIQSADLALRSDPSLKDYLSLLDNDDSIHRYWGAIGILAHIDQLPVEVIDSLIAHKDESASAPATFIAESLVHLNERKVAEEIYLNLLRDTTYTMMDRNFALNSLVSIDFRTSKIETAVEDCYNKNLENMKGHRKYSIYDGLLCEALLKRWNLLPRSN